MKDKITDVLYPGIILLMITVIIGTLGYAFINSFEKEPESEEQLQGRSGPERDIFGTRVSSTTIPLAFFNHSDFSVLRGTTTVYKALLESTDTALITVTVPNASSTSEVYYKIWGSNDDKCDTTATSTTDDIYEEGGAPLTDPIISDINWFDLVDTDSAGQFQNQATFGKENATGTSFILSDMNWGCLKFDATGASSTIWFQLKEKINTIN